jgi:hypothetical protein
MRAKKSAMCAPSLCIAHYTIRRGGDCFKPTWCVHRVVPRAPAGVQDAAGLFWSARGVDPLPEEAGGGNWLVFNLLFFPLCASPRAQTRAWRLLQTYLVRVQGGLQGPKRSD